MRKLAPSGTPITPGDLLFTLQFFGRKKSLKSFRDEICKRLGFDYCLFFSTGRAAMSQVMQCLAEHTPRKEKNVVIIPSYTCYSVPSSVLKAGLKVQVCDINPDTLDYNYNELEHLDFSSVLAVVSSNLYGIPNNLERLEQLASEKEIFFIDDAAQSMGARTQSGRTVGSFGDVGIFSLDKGKVITSMNGGIIATHSHRLSTVLAKRAANLPPAPFLWCCAETIKMLVYAAFLHPSLYWFPASLPFLKLGTTAYTTDYPIDSYNFWLAGLGHSLFKRLDTLNKTRREHGEFYRNNLPHTDLLRHIDIPPTCQPIYLRYPIRITDPLLRANMVNRLSQEGMGVTTSYPQTIVDIQELKGIINTGNSNGEGGRKIASQIVTLPTHHFVTSKDRHKLVGELTDMLL